MTSPITFIHAFPTQINTQPVFTSFDVKIQNRTACFPLPGPHMFIHGNRHCSIMILLTSFRVQAHSDIPGCHANNLHDR